MLKMIKFVGPRANLCFGPLGVFVLIKMKNSRRPSRLSITSLDSGDDKLYQEKLMKDQKKVGHGAWRGNHGKRFLDSTKETWDGNPTPVVTVTANWCSCGWP